MESSATFSDLSSLSRKGLEQKIHYLEEQNLKLKSVLQNQSVNDAKQKKFMKKIKKSKPFNFSRKTITGRTRATTSRADEEDLLDLHIGPSESAMVEESPECSASESASLTVNPADETVSYESRKRKVPLETRSRKKVACVCPWTEDSKHGLEVDIGRLVDGLDQLRKEIEIIKSNSSHLMKEILDAVARDASLIVSLETRITSLESQLQSISALKRQSQSQPQIMDGQQKILDALARIANLMVSLKTRITSLESQLQSISVLERQSQSQPQLVEPVMGPTTTPSTSKAPPPTPKGEISEYMLKLLASREKEIDDRMQKK